jgi:hypothetical protein
MGLGPAKSRSSPDRLTVAEGGRERQTVGGERREAKQVWPAIAWTGLVKATKGIPPYRAVNLLVG